MTTFKFETYRTSRVLRAIRHGNSWPVVVNTEAGLFVVKLRGAAHGTAALVAEIIVAEIAESIGLQVPARAFVIFDDELTSDDRRDELADLLHASHGMNLGFQFLASAHDLRADEDNQIDEDTASTIVWLDWLVMNPDRTARNPNILLSHGRSWLIDHGSSLGFHHNWSSVTEESPGKAFAVETHVLCARATNLHDVDRDRTRFMTRETLKAAVAVVPDDFLRTMRPSDDSVAALSRRRAAYVAFLWKRLQSRRPEYFSRRPEPQTAQSPKPKA